MSGPCAIGLEKVKCLVIGAAGKEVLKPWWEGALMGVVPGGDLFGDRFKCVEVSIGVALAESVIGDDLDAALEEGGEVGVEHGGSLEAWLLAAMHLWGSRMPTLPWLGRRAKDGAPVLG